jgi:hypothetical protein
MALKERIKRLQTINPKFHYIYIYIIIFFEIIYFTPFLIEYAQSNRSNPPIGFSVPKSGQIE